MPMMATPAAVKATLGTSLRPGALSSSTASTRSTASLPVPNRGSAASAVISVSASLGAGVSSAASASGAVTVTAAGSPSPTIASAVATADEPELQGRAVAACSADSTSSADHASPYVRTPAVHICSTGSGDAVAGAIGSGTTTDCGGVATAGGRAVEPVASAPDATIDWS